MAGSERGSMEDLRGQIFTVLGIYEVNEVCILCLTIGRQLTIIRQFCEKKAEFAVIVKLAVNLIIIKKAHIY